MATTKALKAKTARRTAPLDPDAEGAHEHGARRACEWVRSALAPAIDSFIDDPPTVKFQVGYLTALLAIDAEVRRRMERRAAS